MMVDPTNTPFHKYKRHLPHIEQGGAGYFITFKTRKRQLFDEAKQIIINTFQNREGLDYRICCIVVMNDHVHAIILPLEIALNQFTPLNKLLAKIKGVSARKINLIENVSEPLWEQETFDRIIRNERELNDTIEYIYLNPVRAGYVENPFDYRYFYIPDH